MLSTIALPGWSQAVKFEEDALGRGYVARPYLRYEAEQGRCESEGVKFIDARNDYNQENLVSEASFMECAELGARGSSVSWTLDKDADALTIRFSLPDSSDGKGTKQTVGILSDGVKVSDVELDSYWAWQYTVKANVGEKYPDNTPADNKFARMRFDEANVLLPKTLKAGSKLTIVKENDAADAVTIDFVEAEMAQHYAKTDYSGDVVVYEGDGSLLTPEMRIFAMIRLGVTDISKIALFLDYSVNTVNTYKTRAKNKSRLPNDQFEAAIMNIKSV